MKLCHSEAIKKIKELESKKDSLLSQERSRCQITYTDAKEKVLPAYSYSKTRENIKKLDEQIRQMRSSLAKANCQVKVDDFDMTIGEALIYLAQLQNELSVLEKLSAKEQLSQSVNYSGKVQYSECTYDVETAISDAEKLRSVISKLQVAIDRANLTNFIDC